MVNPGHRSTGCLRCKERRVKCDSTKPTCLRCDKLGFPCPGYGNSNEPKFKIVDDTYRTSVRARKTYAKLGKEVEDDFVSNALQLSSGDQDAIKAKTLPKYGKRPDVGTSHNQLLLYPRLSTPSFLQGTVASLVSSFSDPTQDIYCGVFEQAATLYENGPRHLQAAIEAISVLELSIHQASHGYDIRVSVIKSYGYALQLINNCISELDTQVVDQTIMAIFLAIIVERRLNVAQSRGSGLSHFIAIIKLMQLRGRLQLSTLIGRQLLLAACILWHAMVMPLPQPIPFPIDHRICQLLGTYLNDRHARSYQVIPLFNRGIYLRKHALGTLNDMRNTPTSNKRISSRIRKILSQIERLENRFKVWHDDLPSNWPSPSETSANIVMNSMRAHLIFLDDLKVRCYRSLGTIDHTIEGFRYINLSALHTRQMIDQMCATMPYDFGLDTPKARALNIRTVTSPPGDIYYFHHAAFSFPLLVASMVNAGISSVQRHGIIAARRANVLAMRLTEPLREYPSILVELGNEHEPMLLCETCGTEVHYASQRCPGPVETAAPADASLRQSLATFRDRKDMTSVEGDEDVDSHGG